ncbi:class I SAM-dependent methyltransferase [Planktotalea arctica]|uniref:class I SAM-dependent methyltransferase n=1 Tax=Planktotalea arctica TaxID=1481893 RepID=UPI000A176613|nr:class I SAM-dependent methyltransferase [Planktotalea arctica]
MSEVTKPIPVQPPSRNRFLFALRCIFDVQLGSIVTHLKPYMTQSKGRLLDVGAGQMPWLDWINSDTDYVGLDVEAAESFGMSHSDKITYYDGNLFPFKNNSFDRCICIEVLEHTLDPDLLLSEIFRVLKPGGSVMLTVPWSARRHHTPHDFQRFTLEALTYKFDASGFSKIDVADRGTELGVIANKTMVLCVRLLTSGSLLKRMVSLPLSLFSGLVCCVFLAAYSLQKWTKPKRSFDPLGYAITAEK